MFAINKQRVHESEWKVGLMKLLHMSQFLSSVVKPVNHHGGSTAQLNMVSLLTPNTLALRPAQELARVSPRTLQHFPPAGLCSAPPVDTQGNCDPLWNLVCLFLPKSREDPDWIRQTDPPSRTSHSPDLTPSVQINTSAFLSQPSDKRQQ